MKKVFGLFGTGGFAREVMPFVRQSPFFQNEGKDCIVYYVAKDAFHMKALDDVKIITEEEFVGMHVDRYFNIAIASPATRRLIAERILNVAKPIDLIDQNARIVGSNKIANGAIFCSFSLVTSGTRIGRFFHGNYHSSISHDCAIGDFVTFSPGAICGGNVVIDNAVYVGAGAIIRNGVPGRPLRIGEGAVVGMGAVVTKDVPPGATVVGNPAREFMNR
jgi:sugar O-acyltransferase (sialic acid O-acetyltransferase NeuD family)